MTDYAQVLAAQFGLAAKQIQAVIDLLGEGNTIPFIARYRKEAHGSLDDQKIREISDRLDYLRSLDEKRDTIHSLIEAAGAMTDEIAQALLQAQTLSELDDIYRPYRPNEKPAPASPRKKVLLLWPI